MANFTPSEDVLSGETADIYFARTVEILEKEGINPVAVMEFFPRSMGILCGTKEVYTLLSKVLSSVEREVWSLQEGDAFNKKEVVLCVVAPYQSYGLYETAVCGTLAHCSGWATAASECIEAAGDLPVISFGARHVHPSVAGVMDYSAIVGGCQGCSSSIGARLAGIEPSGTIPHALILVMGDTVRATVAFDRYMSADIPRVALVDTFIDEDEESVNVAKSLGESLDSVRLDTPAELGGVTVELAKRVRQRLDKAGFKKVKIFASGGFTPAKIRQFLEKGAPVDGFGVGSYITSADPIDFTADIHQIDGKPIAKRGRTPGITPNPRLKRIM
jgi:nicotinate phosphoribosyltransferase